MPGKTAKITITERQQDILRTVSNAPTASSQFRQRASIILWAFDGLSNPEIADQVGLSRRQVGLWRRRWANAWDRLIPIECVETPPSCDGPSSRSSAMSPGPAPRASSPPSK